MNRKNNTFLFVYSITPLLPVASLLSIRQNPILHNCVRTCGVVDLISNWTTIIVEYLSCLTMANRQPSSSDKILQKYNWGRQMFQQSNMQALLQPGIVGPLSSGNSIQAECARYSIFITQQSHSRAFNRNLNLLFRPLKSDFISCDVDKFRIFGL